MYDPNEQITALLAERERRRRERQKAAETGKLGYSVWFPDRGVYVNRDSGRLYQPHHDEEAAFVYTDDPRYFLCKGGEGSGKSVSGVIKTLERLRRGCSGIMGSPDFEHFKRSLWPEFQRWCPIDSVIPQHRYRLRQVWVPNAPFTLAFETFSGKHTTLLCGGFDEPGAWEGPNVNFAHFDEARRHRNPDMLKVLDGRCRIMGPGDIPPQLYFTTTPKKHWLFEYFGPWQDEGEDPFEAFKKDAAVITLRLSDNADNLSPNFVTQRAQSLTAAEVRVLMDAEWEDVDDTTPFLSNMIWWDACKEDLPPLGREEPMILAIDAATGRKTVASDGFALVGLTRHPDPSRYENSVAVRYANVWRARPGKKIHFEGDEDDPGPIREVRRLCEEFNVVALVYDPVQMIAVAQQLEDENVVWCWEFTQVTERMEADRFLLELITQKRFSHDGDPRLRAHISNADRKVDEKEVDRRKFRIVKGRGPIDLAVASSMGAKRLLELNV